MPLSFPATRPPAVSPTWRWRTRGRGPCPAQSRPAADGHEAMEKLATADDIAAAVRAAGHASRSA